MPDSQLIVFSGMSGAGKSSLSQALADQCEMSGVKHRWLHEEIIDHPIRTGEFKYGSLETEPDMLRNINDMFDRWRGLVENMLNEGSIYIMEGVLYENIDRYFFPGNYPRDRIVAYYDALMDVLSPTNPIVVHLCRSNVRDTLEAMFAVRGEWWKGVILNFKRNAYFADGPGLSNEDAVYGMWENFQDLAGENFDRFNGRKLRIVTDEGNWDQYLKEVTESLGLVYRQPPDFGVENPEQYLGHFETCIEGTTTTVEVKYDGSNLYCQTSWPYMRLIPLDHHLFSMASFPIKLLFQTGPSNEIESVSITGPYGWNIVGRTLQKVA